MSASDNRKPVSGAFRQCWLIVINRIPVTSRLTRASLSDFHSLQLPIYALFHPALHNAFHSGIHIVRILRSLKFEQRSAGVRIPAGPESSSFKAGGWCHG